MTQNTPTAGETDSVRISMHTDHLRIDLPSGEDAQRVLSEVASLVGSDEPTLAGIELAVTALIERVESAKRTAEQHKIALQVALADLSQAIEERSTQRERAEQAEQAREQATASVRRQQIHIEDLQHDLRGKNEKLRKTSAPGQEYAQFRQERDEARWELETLRAALRQLSGQAE